MLIALWIVNVVLAIAMLASGGMKVVSSREAVITRGLKFAEDFSAVSVKLIGIAEVLGAIGLIVPLATRIAPLLSPIAAVCLLVIMVGAVVVHLRRHEPPVPPLVLGLLSIASAILGFAVIPTL